MAQLLIAWSPLSLILLAYGAAQWINAPIEARGYGAGSNRLGFGLHVSGPAEVDRDLFGAVPSVWLQERLVDGSAHWYDAAAALVYVTHFISIPLVTALAWFVLRDRFRTWVASVLAFTTLGVGVYVAYPAAPPWLVSDLGEIGTVNRISSPGWDYLNLGLIGRLTVAGQESSNPVAAMPSLHAGSALLVALFLWPWARRLWRAALVAYVVLMAVTLVYTGEHYVVDVVAGWLTAAAAVALGAVLAPGARTSTCSSQVAPSYDRAVVTGTTDGGQDIRFARSADGTGIAYAVHGSGPPLLIDACWLSHLQFDWQSPVWRHYLVELGRIATVIRYDERGHGLSDRDVTDHSLDARVADLEAVADAAGLDRFALLAMAQGGPVAIEYAARHPARVTRLAFYGSFAGSTAPTTPDEVDLFETMGALIKVGWARPRSEFRRVFTSLMIPGASEEQMRWVDDLQRMAVDAETSLRARAQRQVTDSRSRMTELDLPTLVLHSRGDRMQDFQRARELAAGIRGAQLVALESNNHIVLEDEPAWPVFLREITAFLAADHAPVPIDVADDPAAVLSPRELDILTRAAAGHDNDAIAAELVLSVRTVERHLQNAYAKLGLQGRNARTAAVARLLTRS